MHQRICLILPLVLAACATDPETAASSAASPVMVCEKAPPTGSRLDRRICWTSEDAAHARDDARRLKKSYERTPSVEPKGR